MSIPVGARQKLRVVGTRHTYVGSADARLNWSAHADTQHQVAASRLVLHAVGLRR